MNSRERFLAAMSREIPDRVPRDISWELSPIAFEKFKQNTGLSDYLEYFKIGQKTYMNLGIFGLVRFVFFF